MPTNPQPFRRAERDAIQDVLAVGGSPQAQALRRYEATLQMLDVEVADIIRTQRAQIAAAEQERDAQAARLAAVERVAAALYGPADRAAKFCHGRPNGITFNEWVELCAALVDLENALGLADETLGDGR